jgi:NhaA family Na+:H+ antiporter
MIKSIKNFFELEVATGLLLAITTIAALFIANSAYHQAYHDFFLLSFSGLTFKDWINEALMAIFFLLIGLELKKEILTGELSSKKKITLPFIAAFGGVIIPSLIFCYFNLGEAQNLKGFAIPSATDIAFAYGMISLFGKKFPQSLKIFLVALAVIDDLIAILIIAIFYSQEISAIYILLSFLILFGLLLLNLKNSTNIFFYLFLGILLWLTILHSGLHATLAGVLVAAFIPLKKGLLEKLAHKIAPFVNFIILPIFAFANAGVGIKEFPIEDISIPLILGITLGLFVGKQLGVMLFSFIAIKIKIASLPSKTNWMQFYAMSIFTGIGFTMSLFVGSLAFFGNELLFDEVKIGVLLGSLLSMIYGSLIVFFIKSPS